MSTENEFAAALSGMRVRIDEALSNLVVVRAPERLYTSVRYALESPGKRVRPILTLLAAGLYGVPEERAMPVATSMEVFHTFTLVHDDIMDQSDLRRGRPSVHAKWGESTAILCGDYLSGLAAHLLALEAHTRLRDMLHLHHSTVEALCEGQIMDMAFEERTDVGVDEYLTMIDRKTAALLDCALRMGGLLADAPASHLAALSELGRHLGRAFQIQDDLLDVTATSENWGKPVGGDLIAGKKTFLTLKALETSRGEDRDYFRGILEGNGFSADRIPEAREKMKMLGVLEAARSTVIFHTDRALSAVDELPAGPSAKALAFLVQSLQDRGH
jgi:geranylgeranyl diphosphate synthase type II